MASAGDAEALPLTSIGRYLVTQVGHPGAPFTKRVLQQGRSLVLWSAARARLDGWHRGAGEQRPQPLALRCAAAAAAVAVLLRLRSLAPGARAAALALLRLSWRTARQLPGELSAAARRPREALAKLSQFVCALPGRLAGLLLGTQLALKLEPGYEGDGTILELITGPSGRVEGAAEILGSALLAAAASCVQYYNAVVLGILIARQQEAGISWEWLRLILQYPVTSILATVLQDSTGYLQRRLTLRWRRCATQRLHGLYFSQMRYYRIANDARSAAIADPDIRICSDVKQVVGVVSELMLSLTNALVQLAMFGGVGIVHRHWTWSLAAPSFFVSAFVIIITFYPKDLEEAQRALFGLQGRIVQSLTRVQLHGDRISMLQGEACEGAMLKDYASKIYESSCKERIIGARAQMLEAVLWGMRGNPSFCELTAFTVGACMGVNDVYAGAAAEGTLETLPLDPSQPFAWASGHLGVQMRDLHGFFNACAGCGTFLSAKFALMTVQATSWRVQELYMSLLKLRHSPEATPLIHLPGPIDGAGRVNLVDAGVESVLVGGFSFMARLRLDELQEWTRIFDFAASADCDCVMAYHHAVADGGKTELGFNVNHGSGPWSAVIVDGALELGEEATFLFTVSSTGDMKMYKEGKLIGQNAKGQAPLHVQRPHLWIGAHCEWGQGLIGSITDVRVWNQEVTWEGRPTNTFTDDGPVVSFEGVTVQTPTKHVLLKDLTFRVEEGQHLLICGHNGAGKSSIIRALCSLWPVTEGRIARPGGAVQAEEDVGLHDELYYLPQKPCNVLGTLSDQLTYPLQTPGGLPEEELRRWLRYVDLEYLADRGEGGCAGGAGAAGRSPASLSPSLALWEGDEEAATDWGRLLSMGEQQALSIARLLYHRPRFAILDECTSAVGRGLERRLFEVCRELGISCITITHRPALKEHHERMLQLTGELAGDGTGWKLQDLPPAAGQQRPAARPRCKDSAEVHARVEAFLSRQRVAANGQSQKEAELTEHELLTRRSEEYSAEASQRKQPVAAEVVRQRWPTRFSRLRAILWLGASEAAERRRALRRALKMLLAVRVRTRIFWLFWRSIAGCIQASVTGDLSMVLAQSFMGGLMALACGVVDQLFATQSELLGLDLALSATRRLLARITEGGGRFQRVMKAQLGGATPAVESPMLRIAEAKALYEAMASQINQLVIPVSNLFWMMPMVMEGVGLAMPLLLVVNFVIFRGAQLLAPNFPDLEARASLLESRFQVLHSRLRGVAEAVAFSGGGAAERRLVEPRLEACLQHAERSSRQEVMYNMMLTLFTDYRKLPIWTHRIVSARYTQRNNPVHPAGLPACLVAANLLFDRTIQFPQLAIQRLVKLDEASGRLDGQCQRILELLVACDAADAEEAAAAATAAEAPSGLAPAEEASSTISVRNLDLVTARGACLARGLFFEVAAGCPVLITGPNASGKSLLGSVLLRLWPARGDAAAISVPTSTSPRPPLSALMPAPQQIYLASGPLWAQLSYPAMQGAPREPPFQLQVLAPSEKIDLAVLSAHFAGYGGTCGDSTPPGSGPAAEGGGGVLVSFASCGELMRALARPQDHVVDGEDLDCDLPAGRGQPSLSRMRRCFQAVGIEHVLLREGEGWLAELPWEDVLSGGEQQRLCLARVLYHKPTFALLDECTSMVAQDAEEALYRRVFEEWGITPITLTQRLFMADLYTQELRLGRRSPEGWELTALQRKSPPPAEVAVDAKDAQADVKEQCTAPAQLGENFGEQTPVGLSPSSAAGAERASPASEPTQPVAAAAAVAPGERRARLAAGQRTSAASARTPPKEERTPPRLARAGFSPPSS